MSPRGNGTNYPQAVQHVLRDARRPLTIDELMAGAQRLEPIHATNPKALILHIVEQSSLILPVAGGRWAYLPDLLQDNRFRQPLTPQAQREGFLDLSPELMSALWPGWAEVQQGQEARDALLLLPDGAQAHARRHFRMVGRWGMTASRELWDWLDTVGAQPRDDLLVLVSDADARRYTGDIQCRLRRDEQAIAQRNHQLADAAERVVREAGGEMLMDRLAPRLIVAGAFAEPLAPDPLPIVLATDGRFVDAGLATVALLEGWTEEDERLADMRQRAMFEAVGEVRPRFRRTSPEPTLEEEPSLSDLILAGRYEEAIDRLQRENRIHTDEAGQIVVDLHGLLDGPAGESHVD